MVQRDDDSAHDGDRNVVRPRVRLRGQDGNAFWILGTCNKAATKAGWTTGQWTAFRAEATSRDYNHLLATVIRNFDIE